MLLRWALARRAHLEHIQVPGAADASQIILLHRTTGLHQDIHRRRTRRHLDRRRNARRRPNAMTFMVWLCNAAVPRHRECQPRVDISVGATPGIFAFLWRPSSGAPAASDSRQAFGLGARDLRQKPACSCCFAFDLQVLLNALFRAPSRSAPSDSARSPLRQGHEYRRAGHPCGRPSSVGRLSMQRLTVFYLERSARFFNR